MESNIAEDIISLRETKIEDVLSFESTDTWHIIDANATIYDALAYFSDATKRVQALLITQNGRSREKPLGILTFWDISREMNNAQLA
jgi:predicted transcriptional regulator